MGEAFSTVWLKAAPSTTCVNEELTTCVLTGGQQQQQEEGGLDKNPQKSDRKRKTILQNNLYFSGPHFFNQVVVI